MSYEEAKNEIAKEYGFYDFNDLKILVPSLDILCLHKAAELYAKSKWKEACEAQKLSIMDYYSYHFPIDSDAIARSPKPEFKP